MTMKKQNGFTLIELVISLAIAAIVGIGITTSVIQTVTITTRSGNNMQAIQQLENAGYWVSHDVQMAQTVTTGPSAGFPLILTWADASQNTYNVTFTVTGGKIQRSLVKNNSAPLQALIAQSINVTPSLTNCSYANGILIFNVTATCGTQNLSRTYQIEKRPSQ